MSVRSYILPPELSIHLQSSMPITKIVLTPFKVKLRKIIKSLMPALMSITRGRKKRKREREARGSKKEREREKKEGRKKERKKERKKNRKKERRKNSTYGIVCIQRVEHDNGIRFVVINQAPYVSYSIRKRCLCHKKPICGSETLH